MYKMHECFLRHLCKIHLPVMYKWDCPEWIVEVIAHVGKDKHHLAWHMVLD